MKVSRVSVVIAAYNAEEFIAEAVDSVLAQTYPDVECIVVDDGSTDRTGEIVRAYGDRIRYCWQPNAERSAARNRGFCMSTGEYLTFLDADDYLSPEKFEQQVLYLESHPEYDVVYTRASYFRENGNRRFFEVRRATPSGTILKTLLSRNFLVMGAPLLRKEVATRITGFDEKLSYNEDWDYWLRLAAAGGQFGYLDEVHVYCRQHSANTSKSRLRMYESKLRVVENFVAEYSTLLADLGVNYESVLAFHRADYGRGLILHGAVDQGREEIAAASTVPFSFRWLFKVFSVFALIFGHHLLASIQRRWRGEL